MNRPTRIFAAALSTATLLVVFTPAVQARPLGKPQSLLTADGGWFGTAFNWLTQLLGGPQVPAARNNVREKDGVPTGGGGGGFTGSCIDPNGCVIVQRPGQGGVNSTAGGGGI